MTNKTLGIWALFLLLGILSLAFLPGKVRGVAILLLIVGGATYAMRVPGSPVAAWFDRANNGGGAAGG